MKACIRQFSVVGRIFLNYRFLPSFLILFGGIPLQATAVTVDDQFEFYVNTICGTPPLPDWDSGQLGTLCSTVFTGSPDGSPGTMTSSSNLGIGGSKGGATTRQPPSIKDRLEERKQETEKGASADGGGWGLLFSPQYGKSKRPETELENGYQSALKGLAVGLDYRFSDSFVLGTAIGHTKDEADFINEAGFLKTTSNTLTLYGTWIPAEGGYIDGYLGAGKSDINNQRRVIFGLLPPGTASGDTSGSQIMAGLSAGYRADFDNFNLGPFINLDYIKTTIDGYDESGTTGLELRYSERSIVSTTSSLGGQGSMAFGYDWGTLLPSIRLAAVHEYKSDSQQIGNQLVIAPTTPFLVATDNPDRNFLLTGLGLAAAFNGGTQTFINYEKRSKDKLLNSWAVSIGVLAEF